ncbi:MAG: hypothetical protein ACD_62C00243G0002 [uncultured bacterium]|nr:MAG: hypothetical protein ACD_62C00243G0002 [uncultured bacterium]
MITKKRTHHKVFLGMIVGVLAGLAMQYSGLSDQTIATLVRLVKPVGDIFLRLIFMMVIPLILSALALGIAELGDLRRIGRVGLRTLAYTVLVSTLSVLIGVAIISIYNPGKSLSAGDRAMLMEKYLGTAKTLGETATQIKTRGVMEVLTTIVPKNPVEDMARAFDPTYTGGGLLALMFLALMIGIALSLSPPDKVKTFKEFLEGVYEIVMRIIGFGMALAPFGVAALMFSLTASLGWSILVMLSKYVLLVLFALALHQFGSYSLLVKYLGKMSPWFFFKNIREAMLVAFSTSSSNVTLPTAIKVATENLKLPRETTNFVLTVGSTANQNGTALYEGLTILFLAQCFGVNLSLSQQILVIVMAILGGIGTAGVPGGSLPVMMLILTSIGVPGEGIGIIYGVDRILDMCRTVLNVTGDLTAAVYVGKREQKRTDHA